MLSDAPEVGLTEKDVDDQSDHMQTPIQGNVAPNPICDTPMSVQNIYCPEILKCIEDSRSETDENEVLSEDDMDAFEEPDIDAMK